MYKLIALDMDGTLLNSKGQVLESTINSLRKCRDQGIVVTISTGRPIQGVEDYIELLELEAPIITYNGAMIVDAISKEVTFAQNLNRDDAKHIMTMGLEIDATMTVWSDNKLYSNKNNEAVEQYRQITGVTLNELTSVDALLKQGVTKILWIQSKDKMPEYFEFLEGKVSDQVNYCTSRPTFLEFFHKKVSKATSLNEVAKGYGILQSEVLAFGDGQNDLEMITYAGLGIVMENGVDDLKKEANYITASNDDHGIQRALEKFVLTS